MKCVLGYIDKLEEIKNKKVEELVKYYKTEYVHAFRGENMDYGDTSNTPSMYRYGYDLNALIEAIEDCNISTHKSDFYKLIDSQHYVAISNMLDVSFSVLVGLFFACLSGDSYDGTKDGVLYGFIFPKRLIASKQQIDADLKLLRSGSDNLRELRMSNFRLIQYSNINERVISQSGGFIYFYSDKSPKIPEGYYYKLKISKEDKEKILSELDEYFNINYSTIFPEPDNQKANIEKMLKNQKNSYINSNIDLVLEELDISKVNFYHEIICNMHREDKKIRIMNSRKLLKYYKKNIFRCPVTMDKFEHTEKQQVEEHIKSIINQCESFIISCELEREKCLKTI